MTSKDQIVKVKNKPMEQLTVKEALEQGYERYGSKNREFQHLHMISEMEQSDFDDGNGTIVVANKEASYATLSADQIKEMVIDIVMETEVASMDDTQTLPDLLSEKVAWEEITNKINAVIKTNPYWYLTDIKLVP